MSKKTIEELEFERNRMAILKNNGALNSAKATINNGQKQPWEYEIEAYRKAKRRDQFNTFGAVCGIISLIATIFFNYSTIYSFFIK